DARRDHHPTSRVDEAVADESGDLSKRRYKPLSHPPPYLSRINHTVVVSNRRIHVVASLGARPPRADLIIGTSWSCSACRLRSAPVALGFLLLLRLWRG